MLSTNFIFYIVQHKILFEVSKIIIQYAKTDEKLFYIVIGFFLVSLSNQFLLTHYSLHFSCHVQILTELLHLVFWLICCTLIWNSRKNIGNVSFRYASHTYMYIVFHTRSTENPITPTDCFWFFPPTDCFWFFFPNTCKNCFGCSQSGDGISSHWESWECPLNPKISKEIRINEREVDFYF